MTNIEKSSIVLIGVLVIIVVTTGFCTLSAIDRLGGIESIIAEAGKEIKEIRENK